MKELIMKTMTRKQINWKASKAESQLFSKLVERALPMIARLGIDYDAQSLRMDLMATHLNGMPLDLERLLSFPDFDFAHDVFGIRRHINRSTGELEGFFVPRCSRHD